MGAPNSEKESALTAAMLRERVSYDPRTGIMRWRANRYSHLIGKEIGTLQNGYRTVTLREGRFRVHRLIWLYFYGEWPGEWVDHINRDPADNRIENLRLANPFQSVCNRRAQSARPLKGITRVRERWGAQIRENGRNVWLGVFATPEEAHAAYAARAIKLHGEFVNLS